MLIFPVDLYLDLPGLYTGIRISPRHDKGVYPFLQMDYIGQAGVEKPRKEGV